MTPFAFALASALLAGDVPTEQRIAKLTPFFKPPPGEALAFDEAELRDLGKKLAPGKLRGQVMVSPPKGTCLTVQRDPNESDDVVCNKTALTFSYSQLDKNGRLNWQVSTGEGDFGTRLSWHTPYRVAVVTPFDRSIEDQPSYRYVKKCDAFSDPEKGRRIVLTMVDGAAWVIRFPENDQLLVQPEAIPNLFMTQTQARVSVSDAAENNKQKEAEHGEAKPAGEGAGEAKPAVAPEAPQAPDEHEDRLAWAVPRRGAFTMSASNFQPFGSVAPGMRGECRYTFDGPAEDPNTGRIECHEVDGFKQVFIPLTCLSRLRK